MCYEPDVARLISLDLYCTIGDFYDEKLGVCHYHVVDKHRMAPGHRGIGRSVGEALDSWLLHHPDWETTERRKYYPEV